MENYHNGWSEGKLQRKVFFGAIKMEALTNAQKYQIADKPGQLPADDKITLQEWVKTWLFQYMANELRKSSLAKYEPL